MLDHLLVAYHLLLLVRAYLVKDAQLFSLRHKYKCLFLNFELQARKFAVQVDLRFCYRDLFFYRFFAKFLQLLYASA